MSGGLIQLIAIGDFDNYIPNNNIRHVIEDRTLIFNNNVCSIIRVADLFLPNKIICYNCNDDFNIKDIKLQIGGYDILDFDTDIMNNIVDFIEDIDIGGNLCKIYHLDKTKLFFNIKLISLTWHEVRIKINNSGNCNNIKLIGKYTYLNTVEKEQMATNHQEDMISQYIYGKFNYTQGSILKTSINGNVNGFILSNLSVDNIKSIKIKLNNIDRLYYSDKIEILLNTHKINDNSIYINLNDSHYMDLPTNSSLNCSRIDQISFIIESEDDNIDLHISTYSANIYQCESGIGGLKYHINSNIFEFSQQSNQQSNQQQFIIKPLEGNDVCPVLQEEIGDKYISCGVCKYNFDYSVYDNWVKGRRNCPHCRSSWTNNNIYQIPNN